MGPFRNLTFLLLLVTIAINVEARFHKRRFLQDPKDDLGKTNFRKGKFILPQPPASGGSPTCIITRNKRSIEIENVLKSTAEKLQVQARQPPLPPASPPPPGTPPPTPPPPIPSPPPPAPPTVPSTPPPVVPPSPPLPASINCIIVDKSSPAPTKWRSLDSDDDEVVTELKSASTVSNHRRRTIQTRQQIRKLLRT